MDEPRIDFTKHHTQGFTLYNSFSKKWQTKIQGLQQAGTWGIFQVSETFWITDGTAQNLQKPSKVHYNYMPKMTEFLAQKFHLKTLSLKSAYDVFSAQR